MSKKKLVVGTCGSQLALWQADYVIGRLQQQYPDLNIEKRLMTTKGDKILNAPLAKIGGKGLFTKELEVAMVNGEIDIAVHSLKDMPVVVPEGLEIACITERADVQDAFVSLRYKTLEELPQGAKVGTSSLRRKAQLLHLRPDLNIQDLRGNVNTRLAKLESESFDAIILASAGLKRLGFEDRISSVLTTDQSLPAVGQGALAIECRADDEETKKLISFLNDAETAACTRGERGFLAAVEGGCQVPVGVYGQVQADNLKLEAIIASLDGTQLLRESITGPVAEAEALGQRLAQNMLDKGGRAILAEIGINL